MRKLVLAYFICSNIDLAIFSKDNDVRDLDDETRLNRAEPASDENEISGDSESICWMTLNSSALFKTLDEIDGNNSKTNTTMNEREKRLQFFHRMKLRNNTHFRVNFIHNDISKMMITINLALVDLHLKGAYERALTEDDPSVLIYAPNFGEVEFLLKNVKYLMKGQYRLVNKHLTIELVKSDIEIEETLMMYTNQAIESAAIRLEKEKMGAFLSRLQNDLDEWMKDYFNDYLIYIELDGIEHMQELECQISLHDGALHGLNSMFRRSVPTGYKMDKVRKIDSIVAFSNLKVVYKYEAIIPTGVPSLSGELTLSANEVAARLGLSVIEEPDTVDLDIQFLNQMKAESLTVEGPANTLIANFRHVLENEIITLMASSLVHGVESLKSLPHCGKNKLHYSVLFDCCVSI
ncbi:hypothetical protein HF086_015336 [Spodoptera exigua]|uniref:Uncharacterized protein n=1 Tax=Spodoptera exigua TaxID=7107 RepID=A0A922M1A1_SPOEX|nr:hypothetical protein HF086_015336 [Spodoptera exigua]